MFRNIWLTVSIVASMLALQGLAVAEEDDALPIVEEWSISAKVGSESAFMDALKAHVIWRRDNDDPWTWNLYTPQT